MWYLFHLNWQADCADCDFRLNKVPARDWPEGSMRPIYRYKGNYPSTISSDRGDTWLPSNLEGSDHQLKLWGNESVIEYYIPQVKYYLCVCYLPLFVDRRIICTGLLCVTCIYSYAHCIAPVCSFVLVFLPTHIHTAWHTHVKGCMLMLCRWPIRMLCLRRDMGSSMNTN